MESFLTTVDSSKLYTYVNDIATGVDVFNSIVTNIVQNETRELDVLMENIRNDVILVEDCSTDVIEKYFLELSNSLYFVYAKQEKIGMTEILSKSAYKELYNTVYLDSREKDLERKNKTTVAELTAIAENSTLYESAANSIYDSAYTIIKNKINSCQTMISTLSKILSKRMQEMQLSSFNAPGKVVLNE